MYKEFQLNVVFKLALFLCLLFSGYTQETKLTELEKRNIRNIVNLEIIPNANYDQSLDNLRALGGDYELELVIGKRGNQAGEFLLPTHVELKDEFVYITDFGNKRIQQFKQNGEFVSVLPFNDLKAPRQFHIYQDKYFIIDTETNNIRIYNQNFALLYTIGESGADIGKLSHPNSLVIDDQGLAWVADDINNRVSIFSLKKLFGYSDHYFMSIDEYVVNSFLNVPKSLIINEKQDEYYLIDAGSTKALAFDKEGNFKREIKIDFKGFRVFMPQNIAVDKMQHFYISDYISQRIIKFDNNGNSFGEVGYLEQINQEIRQNLAAEDSLFNYPSSLAISNSGGLWVVDWGNNQVKLFTVDYFKKGFKAYKNLKFTLAIDYFKRCAEENPNYHLVEFYLAMCHYYIGELETIYEKRLDWFKKASVYFDSLILKSNVGKFKNSWIEQKSQFYLNKISNVLIEQPKRQY